MDLSIPKRLCQAGLMPKPYFSCLTGDNHAGDVSGCSPLLGYIKSVQAGKQFPSCLLEIRQMIAGQFLLALIMQLDNFSSYSVHGLVMLSQFRIGGMRTYC